MQAVSLAVHQILRGQMRTSGGSLVFGAWVSDPRFVPPESNHHNFPGQKSEMEVLVVAKMRGIGELCRGLKFKLNKKNERSALGRGMSQAGECFMP